jgi:Uma2 family endonuclease
VATTTSLTIDDFERLPADAVENRELVDGELIDVSGNTRRHNKIRDRLIKLLLCWLEAGNAGDAIAEQEFDFQGNAHAPDVSFSRPDKLALADDDKRVQRYVPDLAVEIASPSDTYDNLLRKTDRYLHAGVSEVWLISSGVRQITIYTAQDIRLFHSGGTLNSELLPGFSVAVDELFAD